MSPQEFVEKWRSAAQSERASAQSHFLDLCELLGEPKPHDVDPAGDWYAFEKGAKKTGGGDGWADVWRRGAFAWEYKVKGKHLNLEKALAQVKQYAAALENPPLLVASDISRTVVITNWTNTVSVRHEISLEDLLIPAKRDLLKKVFRGDESLRTGESRAHLTQKVAREFAALAGELETAGHPPLAAAHFVNRLVFCMFAEDAGLLGDNLFTKMLDAARPQPDQFVSLAEDLFNAMSKGGRVGFHRVDWFNGGLFEDGTALPLTRAQIDRVRKAAALDWSAIDPSILGTLFERGLDPAKRSQLGAHYTDPENIMRIVEPVVLRPLTAEWVATKAQIEGAKAPAKRRKLLADYLARLRGVTILDPACGSGNFLYLALRGLKDLEHRVLLEAEGLGLGRAYPEIGPEILRGIELSPYAAELARVSIWIGELQWQLEHGFNVNRNPILKPLDTIENRDALLSLCDDGQYVVASWPPTEFIIGNPPFLGSKALRWDSKHKRPNLGDEYVDILFATYAGRVSHEADLCVYWFDKAREQIQLNLSKRAGLIATQGIRGGANGLVLKRIKECGDIFFAWSDLDWVLEGANVHVSIVGFDDGSDKSKTLDGSPVADITARLSTIQTHTARPLAGRCEIAFQGTKQVGPFSVSEAHAIGMLKTPPLAGRCLSDVIKPWYNTAGLYKRIGLSWIIDFNPDSTAQEAVLYQTAYEYIEAEVKRERVNNRRPSRAEKWWIHGDPQKKMRRCLEPLSRFLVTGTTAKHRIFAWLSQPSLPDSQLIAFAYDDDYFFGLLQSIFHESWSLAQGTQLEDRPRYTPTTCFETFPFPEPTDTQRDSIASAARELNTLRENWLNPPEWTQEETLVFPATVGGPWHRWIPDADSLPLGTVAEARYVRRVPKPAARAMVAARTLTKLYNEPPAWLRLAHERLDAAVAEAYGFPPDLSDSEILSRLLDLNLSQASEKPRSGVAPASVAGQAGGRTTRTSKARKGPNR